MVVKTEKIDFKCCACGTTNVKLLLLLRPCTGEALQSLQSVSLCIIFLSVPDTLMKPPRIPIHRTGNIGSRSMSDSGRFKSRPPVGSFCSYC